MKFSERNGYKPIKETFQIDSIDEPLRNSIWNALQIYYWDSFKITQDLYTHYYLSGYGNEKLRMLIQKIWIHYFKKPIDELGDDWQAIYKKNRNYYFESIWFEIYDFIEFIVQNYDDANKNSKFIETCNYYLEREMSVYRFTGNIITKITSEVEIAAIEDTLNASNNLVKRHFTRSLELLSDRKNPDYRNSIKESISAVEALAINITGNDKATLGQLLGILEKTASLHPALKEGFSKIYGYTSNADGIRHALMDDDTVTFEKAKFMLVACSAFTNYISSTISIKK